MSATTGTAVSTAEVLRLASERAQKYAQEAHTRRVAPSEEALLALTAARVAPVEDVARLLDDLAGLWTPEASFSPEGDEVAVDAAHRAWTRSVERSKGWATNAP